MCFNFSTRLPIWPHFWNCLFCALSLHFWIIFWNLTPLYNYSVILPILRINKQSSLDISFFDYHLMQWFFSFLFLFSTSEPLFLKMPPLPCLPSSSKPIPIRSDYPWSSPQTDLANIFDYPVLTNLEVVSFFSSYLNTSYCWITLIYYTSSSWCLFLLVVVIHRMFCFPPPALAICQSSLSVLTPRLDVKCWDAPWLGPKPSALCYLYPLHRLSHPVPLLK